MVSLKYVNAKMLTNRPLKVILWPSSKGNEEFKIQHSEQRNEKRKQ